MQAPTRAQPQASDQAAPAPMPAFVAPWRALGVGSVGVAFLCAITPYNDFHLHNTFLYGNHLPIGALFLFAALVLALNPVARRRAPCLALSRGELLMVWVMLTCGAGLASSGLWRYLGPMVVAPAYFANSGRPWLGNLARAPDWLLLTRDPRSPLALAFYHGLAGSQAVPWAAWARVVVGWGTAFALMVAISIGIAALFRYQWLVRERLSYPLARLPLEIVGDDRERSPLTRSRLFWLGCLLVVAVHGISTAHAFAPAIPGAPDRVDISGWQQVIPWDALELPALEVFYAVIGAIFLLPTDVSLSLWGTFIALHLFRVVRVKWGMEPLVIGPLNHEGAMGAGAFVVWAAWLLWMARGHLAYTWRAALRPRPLDAEGEPVSPRWALALIAVGSAGLLVWMAMAGIPLGLAAIVLGLMLVILLVLARIMAEAGLLFLMTPFIPTDLMAFWGTRYYTDTSASVTLLTEVVLIHDPREHVLPAITNAFALSGGSRVRPRAFTGAIAAAIAVGFVVSFVSFVAVNYRYGAITLDAYGTDMAPHWSLDRAADYVRMPLAASAGDLQALGAGAALAALFAYLRSRFLWWPIGPIGLAMGSTYAMNRIWFSVFIGWLCKAIALRAGGLKAYRAALPLFLGLLLGEGIFGGISILWGILTGAPTPPFLPN